MPGDTWVIVLTYNQWQNTCACLGSLYAQPQANFRVLIVDNGSSDETLTALPREFPQAEIITNPANLGYARGNNVGIEFAARQGAEYVAIVNNDVIVAPAWFKTLQDNAEKNPRAALAGPMVYHANEKDVIQSAGGLLSRDLHAFHRGMNETDLGQFDGDACVDWLTGCAVLARVSALEKIGLLDPSFFMYGEDVDWGIRAQRAGFQVLFVPRARVWHKGVQREYLPEPYVTYYTARNELRLIRKHRGGRRAYGKTLARHLRTLTAWTLLPRWSDKRAHRSALARALWDDLRDVSGPANLG